jgi:curved DNA-binding protein CbpA
MSIHSSLYDILRLPRSASIDQIKSAFRKSALRHHPDRSNDPESEACFRIIYNAYSTLSDPEKRKRYDSYLASSAVFRGASGPTAGSTLFVQPLAISGPTTNTLETLLGHLNYVLWDIDDFIRSQPDWRRRFNGISVHGYVVKMLRFIDKWILTQGGFPDYFFQARRMNSPAQIDIPSLEWGAGHRPFMSLNDYFYNIRVRADKFLKNAELVDLVKPLADSNVRIIDCVLEAHNLCVHYLAALKAALTGQGGGVPLFRHTDPGYDG